jgi:hypothetical protein
MTVTAPPQAPRKRTSQAPPENRPSHNHPDAPHATGNQTLVALVLAWLPLAVCFAFLLLWTQTSVTPDEEAEAASEVR